MERRREQRQDNGAGWMSVPQFGAWDKNGGASPNYSMVFGQAREKRKEAKKNVKHLSLGNEADFISRQSYHHSQHHNHHHRHHQRDRPAAQDDDSFTRKKTFLTYVTCCVRPYQ